MSEATIALKAQQVSEVADKFKSAASAVVVDVRGLTVEQANNLRSELRSEGVELRLSRTRS